MRNLRINKQTITYQNPTGETSYEENTDGLKTGRIIPAYGTEAEYKTNIRISRGDIWLRDFGISTEWDAMIETSDPDCPLTEKSLVYFKGKKFVVNRVNITINGLRIYLAEVK